MREISGGRAVSGVARDRVLVCAPPEVAAFAEVARTQLPQQDHATRRRL